MRKNNKQVTTYFILLALLLIGIVYAILQANLQINGTAKITQNTWDIHFDNIQVNENSVFIGENDSAAAIDPENNCKVDFEVTLSLPGDFYEFTVDVVNEGTIDGMIGELNKTLKINNEVVQEVPSYLNYSVTYDDDSEILENHLLESNSTLTYKVRLEYRSDIEELPSATTISTSLEPVFIQSDNTSMPVGYNGYVYAIPVYSAQTIVSFSKGDLMSNHSDKLYVEEPSNTIYIRFLIEGDRIKDYNYVVNIDNVKNHITLGTFEEMKANLAAAFNDDECNMVGTYYRCTHNGDKLEIVDDISNNMVLYNGTEMCTMTNTQFTCYPW